MSLRVRVQVRVRLRVRVKVRVRLRVRLGEVGQEGRAGGEAPCRARARRSARAAAAPGCMWPRQGGGAGVRWGWWAVGLAGVLGDATPRGSWAALQGPAAQPVPKWPQLSSRAQRAAVCFLLIGVEMEAGSESALPSSRPPISRPAPTQNVPPHGRVDYLLDGHDQPHLDSHTRGRRSQARGRPHGCCMAVLHVATGLASGLGWAGEPNSRTRSRSRLLTPLSWPCAARHTMASGAPRFTRSSGTKCMPLALAPLPCCAAKLQPLEGG